MKFAPPYPSRLAYRHAAPDGIQALGALSGYVSKAVDARLRALIDLRVSQINGCAYCVNMHTEEARAAGETQQRLDVLPVWHETAFFTEPERAALNWAENVTRLGEEAVPDALFAEMKRHFSEKEIVDLTLATVAINAWNRISIAFGNRPAPRK